MKLRKFVLTVCGLTAMAALAACSSTNNSSSSAASSSQAASPRELKIVMVASNDADTVETRAKALIPYLNKYVESTGYTFNITVSASYAAAAEALVAKQADASFLPAGTYAQYTTTDPGSMNVICASSRAGYKVQCDDFPGLDAEAQEKQRQAMNGKDGYEYRGQQSTTTVSFYSSVMYCRRDAYSTSKSYKTFDTDNDGEITIKELHDGKAVFGIMSETSSAGYIYPTYWAYQKGYTKGFVSAADYENLSAADKEKALIGVNQSSYPAGVAGVMEGTIDVSCGFMDTRYGSAWVQEGGAYYHDDGLFTNTYTVAVTDPIMNDTITGAGNLETAASKAIFDAFVAASKDGTSSDTNTPAGILYQIYSHTGYVTAADSDYDSARAMYAWQQTTRA